MIDKDIAQAIQNWMAVQIHEHRGPGNARFDGYEGYTFAEMLTVLETVCPDAIARMLQAGASAYLNSEQTTEIVIGWPERGRRRTDGHRPNDATEGNTQDGVDPESRSVVDSEPTG